jgi:hypothetical protein
MRWHANTRDEEPVPVRHAVPLTVVVANPPGGDAVHKESAVAPRRHQMLTADAPPTRPPEGRSSPSEARTGECNPSAAAR